MQFEESQAKAGMLEKVRALLAKAESTEFPEEAEAFAEKAQRLMAKYSIDVSLLAATASTGAASSPGSCEITIESPYADPKFLLLSKVMKANDCNAVWDGYRRKAMVIGFEHDRELGNLLFTSLLTQATSAMLASGSHVDFRGTSRTKSFRRAFLIAYAHRIGERLRDAREDAVQDAAAHSEVSIHPVLASKAEAVQLATNEAFPSLRSMRTEVSNGMGYRAGWHAGGNAQLGTTRSVRAG
jgi:hypothetical protein